MESQRIPIVLMSFSDSSEVKEAFTGIKEAVGNVTGLHDKDLEFLRVDNYMRTGNNLPCVSEALLARIRNAPYIICDTTENRPNVYFELGYAMGHNKAIFLVHRAKSEPPHFDIRNHAIIYYQGGIELRDLLTDKIKKYLENTCPDNDFHLIDFFRRCNIPITPLEGDGSYQYEYKPGSNSSIRIIKVNKTKFVPPPQWIDIFSSISKEQKRFADNNSISFFNGNLWRVVDFTPERNEQLHTRSLLIKVQPTDYYTFTSSNHCWNWLDPSKAKELYSHEIIATQNLRDSFLANALSVNIAIICHFNHTEYILFQERNIDKVFHCRQRFSCAVGGMTSSDRDERALGPNLYSTVKNEVLEEIGLKADENEVIFRALVRDTKNFEIAMLGEIYREINPKGLLNPSADCFEYKTIRGCRLTPHDLYEYIRAHGGFDNFTPMCLGTFIFSLLSRYSAEDIENVFNTKH